MPPLFRSHLPRVLRTQLKIGEAAVRGAVIAVQNRAKLNVRGGFKSGRFVTGRLFNDITHEVIGGLHPMARVGTTLDYGAFWELGHHNTFTRQYEREEWLKPAFDNTHAEQAEFARLFAAEAAGKAGVSRARRFLT